MKTIDELREYEAALCYIWDQQLKGVLETGRAINEVRAAIKDLDGEVS